MTLKTLPFDPADFLQSVRAQKELLADALATGDAGYIANALGVIARARGMSTVSEKTGLAREALYKSLSATGDPKLSTLLSVTRALGLEISMGPAKLKPERTRA